MKKIIEIKDKDGNVIRRRVQVVFDENRNPSKTQQHMKDQCNINKIMERYKKTGEITHLRSNAQAGVYLDLSEIGDYQESLNAIQHANDTFAQLPSHVRQKFGNDPNQLIEFVRNSDKNYDEGVKLGLFEPKKQESEELKELKALNKNLNTKNSSSKSKSKNTPDDTDPA